MSAPSLPVLCAYTLSDQRHCGCDECLRRRLREFKGNSVLAPLPKCEHGEFWRFCPHGCRSGK